MRRSAPPHVGVARKARPPARSVLGASHPLVRTIEALSAVASQSVAVAAVLAAGLGAAASDATWGIPVAGSAAVVLVFLAVAAGLLLQRRREAAVELIAAGEGNGPIAAVEREHRRLADRRVRWRLAASLDGLVDAAAHPPAVFAPPLFDPVLVLAAARELREIATLLRAEHSDVRAVALVCRLICDGVASPLHRANLEELCEELARIRFVLRAAGAEVPRGPARGLGPGPQGRG